MRICFPEVGIVMSTREDVAFRDALVPLGITMMSAGSHTEPGGYTGQGKQSLHQPVHGRRIARDDAAPDDAAVPDQHRADEGVGLRAPAAALCELERLVHVSLVVQQQRPGAVLQGGRRRGVAACFSHPDCDRRPRSSTWSASEEVRGL